MFVDFHSNFIPGIDDGARDLEMSLEMMSMLEKQGVGILVATPHFYPHKQGLDDFLRIRQNSLDLLNGSRREGMPVIIPAAEVYIEHDVQNLNLRPLCFEGTDYLLVELPYSAYESWFIDEVYNLCINQSLTPIFAHLDRYITIYNQDAINEIIDFDDAVIQVNYRALFESKLRKAVIKWIKDGHTVVFGSDCHNVGTRQPDDLKAVKSVIQSKLGKDWLNQFERISLEIIKGKQYPIA